MTVNESSKADVVLRGDQVKRAEHLLGVAEQENEIIYNPDLEATIVTVNLDIAEQVSVTLSDGDLEVAGIFSFQPKSEHLRGYCLGKVSCPNPSTLQAAFRHMCVSCCADDECKAIAKERAVSTGLNTLMS
jgi:hypothetical protein